MLPAKQDLFRRIYEGNKTAEWVKSLLNQDKYNEVIEYMLQERKKLEQEIISWMACGEEWERGILKGMALDKSGVRMEIPQKYLAALAGTVMSVVLSRMLV